MFLITDGAVAVASDNADKLTLDMTSLPDEALITLLCATEDEIETYGERSELKQLLRACTMELLRRPPLLKAGADAT